MPDEVRAPAPPEGVQVQLNQKVIHMGVLPNVVIENDMAAPAFINPATGVANVFMLTPAGFLELAFRMMLDAPTEMLTDEARGELTKKLTGGIVLPNGADLSALKNGRPQ